jgi:hypothetical protein
VNFLLLGFWFSCMFVFWISFVTWFVLETICSCLFLLAACQSYVTEKAVVENDQNDQIREKSFF